MKPIDPSRGYDQPVGDFLAMAFGGRVDTKVRYLFSGYRFPIAGGGAVVWRGSRPRRLGAPFSIQACPLGSKKKGFGCLGEEKNGRKWEKWKKNIGW